MLTDRLLFANACHLNLHCPPDPKIGYQSLCGHFNAEVDRLILNLWQEVVEDYEIVDQQERNIEDLRLTA